MVKGMSSAVFMPEIILHRYTVNRDSIGLQSTLYKVNQYPHNVFTGKSIPSNSPLSNTLLHGKLCFFSIKHKLMDCIFLV